MDTMCGDLQRAAHEHMEDLAWSVEKREGGGDIIDLLIRACFIQGLYDERIKTVVNTKGSINSPMVQLVEVALEEESAIRSERFRRNLPELGQMGNQRNKDVHWVKNERKEVRVATQGCHRCHKKGRIARNCVKLPLSVGEARVTDTSGKRHRGCLGNRR